MGEAVQFSGVIAMHEWSTLKKLIWLYAAKLKGGASAIIETITGNLPLVLQNAVQHSIKSLTRYGLCTHDGTPTPSAPVDIMCNNGALRVNRLDLDNAVNGYYWSATGVYTETAAARLSNTIPVKRGDVIAVTTETVRSGTLNIRYNQFDDSGNWVSQTVYAQYSNAPHTEYITIAQDGFFNFSGNYIASQSTYVDWEGAVIINTTDPVFADGTPEVLTVSADGAETQTVTDIPMLLGVGDYKDEAELISGLLTHKVGIKVFDGTESFGKSSAYGTAFYIRSAEGAWGAKKEIVMCSHYLGLAAASSAAAEDTCFFNESGHFYFRVADNSDTAAFKADLAEKYASGNPVILLYPLATETTEQATPQAISANEGTNIVDSVANVNPLTAEVKYYASVEN